MRFFPSSSTMFVDTVSDTPTVLGMGRLRFAVSIASLPFEGILHKSVMDNLFEDQETSMYAYLGDDFYQVYFSKIKPIAECNEYTYLFGHLRSSEGLRVPKKPRLKFPGNSNFLNLLNMNCFKDKMFSEFAQRMTQMVDEEGESTVEYYPCIYEGRLGICFNTNLIM